MCVPLSVGTDPDGCTLPFLLDWASDRLGRLIQEKDKNSEEYRISRTRQVDGSWVEVTVRGRGHS